MTGTQAAASYSNLPAAKIAAATAPSRVVFKQQGPYRPFDIAPVPHETVSGARTRLASTVPNKTEWIDAQFYAASDAEIVDLETAEEGKRIALESAIIGRGELIYSEPVEGGMCFLVTVGKCSVEAIASC